MGADIVAAFHNDYKGGVEEFEKKTGIQMPKDIARLLGYQVVFTFKSIDILKTLQYSVFMKTQKTDKSKNSHGLSVMQPGKGSGFRFSKRVQTSMPGNPEDCRRFLSALL